VGVLVLDIQLSCQGVVSQCVCVESSSWFDSLNRPDHDMTPSQRLTLPRVRFKVMGSVHTGSRGEFWVGSCRHLTGHCCVCLLGSLLWSVVLLTERLRDWFWVVLTTHRFVVIVASHSFQNTHVLWFVECLSLVSGGGAQSLCLRLLWFF